MKRKGFTIIELLMVVAIMATLLGIITTAVFASINQARDRRTQAMKQTIQNGIAAYRQLKDEWPEQIETWADKSHNGKLGYLSNNDYDKVMQALLKQSVGKNMKNRVMDPVGLLIMGKNGTDGKSSGVDFRSAAQKNGPYAKRMSTSEMTVVYQGGNGKAYRYVIEYNTESDSVTVMTQGDYNSKYEPNWNGGEKWH